MKQQQHSIVSGGGSGLGLGLVKRLLRRGGDVTILDLSLSDDVRRQLDEAASGSQAWAYYPVDLTDDAAVVEAVQDAVERFGPPRLAINSAGILINQPFADTRAADFRRVVDVNLSGSFHFAAAVLPYLAAGSRLALIASMAGLTSSYGYSAYGASKFGVVGLATTLRYEYEPLGIGITCVCPPEVRTPMVAQERTPGNASPVALALKDLAGSLEVDAACDRILAGIDAGRWMVIPGVRAKLTTMLARHAPDSFFFVMNRIIRRLLHKQGLLQARNGHRQVIDGK